MTNNEDHSDESEAGYGASEEGDMEDAPEQQQPELREPPTDEEAELDDYAESDGDA
jgi:hypothetical protein